jgi:hypothetical protein
MSLVRSASRRLAGLTLAAVSVLGLSSVAACGGAKGTGSATESAAAQSTSDALQKLSAARQKLESLLTASGNSYQWEKSFGSWSGSGSTTRQVFQHGVAVQRSIEQWRIDPGSNRRETTDYKSEIGPDVGTNPGGEPVADIRALYDRCANEVLTQPDANHPSLQLDANGLLEFCTYAIPACQDDCSQGVSITGFQSFDLSLSDAAMQAKLAQAGGTYSYVVGFGSFSGYSSQTTIAFANGQVASRDFKSQQTSGLGGTPTVLAQWHEDASQIGSHQDGAPAKSLEDLYGDCRTALAGTDLTRSSLSLDFDADGVLQRCSFLPVGCMDDCSQGVAIESLKFGP